MQTRIEFIKWQRKSNNGPTKTRSPGCKDHGFDLIEAPGAQTRVFLKKYNCSAAIQKTDDGGAKIFAYPGYMIGSEISKLVNRGYQQFLKTTKTEVPATADHLKALQQFSEELKEALGIPSLYNESLGR